VACYERAHDEVRDRFIGPAIGTTFLYEDLLGLLGQSPADVEQVFDYDPVKVGFYGLGSFPGISVPGVIEPPFDVPADVPDSYWTQFEEFVNQSVVVETAWSADCAFGGSPVEQAEWVARSFELVDPGPEPESSIRSLYYFFMADPVQRGFLPYFESTGLIDADGVEREAFRLWSQVAGFDF